MAEAAILAFLQQNDSINDSKIFAQENDFPHDDIVNAIKSLHASRFIEFQDIKVERLVVTDEGKTYAEQGSPEVQLFLALPIKGEAAITKKKLEPSVFKIGFLQAVKNKWIELANKSYVSRVVEQVDDKVRDILINVQNGETIGPDDISALKKRKLITSQIWKSYMVTKGPNYAPKRKKAATDLNRENRQRGEWKELEFKEYNFLAKGQPTEGGYLHPLLKVRRQVQMIFLQMGFEEMATNNFVESSFWNFDALFQPQQHPARDSHDTFFLKAFNHQNTARRLRGASEESSMNWWLWI